LKYILTLLTLLLPTLAQAQGWPAVNSPIPTGRNAIGVVGSVATNALLAATNTTDYPNGVTRLDYAAGRNAGPLYFTPQTGTCASHPGMTNDGGRCVDTVGGNSWLAVHPEAGSSPKQWGCVGNGVADDTTCIQTMFSSAGNRKINIQIGRLEMYGISSTISCVLPIKVTGSTAGQSVTTNDLTGFRALVPNLTMFSLGGGCSGSLFENLFIDMANAGKNTSGAAIQMGTAMMVDIPGRIHLNRIAIKGPCIGVDLNGNNIHLERSYIYDVEGVGCGAIRVGHWTQIATVGPRITGTTVVSKQIAAGVVPADFGMRFEDSGGTYAERNDVLFFTKGTVLMPGDKQGVQWGFWNNTVLGDTTIEEGLFLDTAASTITTFMGNTFNGVWTAAFTTTSGASGVSIKNTANAPLTKLGTLSFNNSRFYSTSGNGVDILSGQYISLNGNEICAYGRQGTASVGINVAANLNYISITNNTISPDCAGGSGTESAAVAIGGNHLGLTLTGNTFKLDPAHVPVVYNATTGVDRLIIENNYPLSAACGTVPVTASITFTIRDCDFLTGTGVINHIDNSAWYMRKHRLFITGTGISFVTGGAAASGASGPILGNFTPPYTGYIAEAHWNPVNGGWVIR
jgi:hypothetical protein